MNTRTIIEVGGGGGQDMAMAAMAVMPGWMPPRLNRWIDRENLPAPRMTLRMAFFGVTLPHLDRHVLRRDAPRRRTGAAT